jgi:hypothetical protein
MADKEFWLVNPKTRTACSVDENTRVTGSHLTRKDAVCAHSARGKIRICP